VIEDAAQSMGANWRGHLIGSIGDLVSISFHANKNITTAEGGCLVLNSETEARPGTAPTLK
jgi:dTDP-4-amino-4,6-dideoxygalactose transaminase